MSVQVTLEITRKDAEDRVVDELLERERKELKSKVMLWSNEQLEDKLESTFYNYTIKG